MVSINSTNIYDEVEHLLSQNNFRRAYKLWQDLVEREADGEIFTVNLNDVRSMIETRAAEKREELVKLLDEAVKSEPIEDYDETTVENLLRELEQATLTQNIMSSDYDTFERMHTRRSTEKRNRIEYQRVDTQVRSKWVEGETLTRDASAVGQAAVLIPFDEALQIVEEAVAHSPDNKYLQNLLDQAKERRERFAKEEEIMTSGGQTGDFVVVLNHINKAENDEYVMVYDNAGRVLGRYRKEEAYEEVIKQARPYVRDKLITYLDNASNALKDKNPRLALEELKRAEKFDELRQIVPNIIPNDNYSDYQKTLSDAKSAQQALERAEEAADDAVDKASTAPKDAWTAFERALTIYPDSEKNSNKLMQARRNLIDRTISYLNKAANEIEELLEHRQFDKARNEVNLLLNQYASVSDVSNAAIIDRIKQFGLHIDDVMKSKAQITSDLSEILKLTDKQQTEAAQTKLGELRSRYGTILLQEDSLWVRVTEHVTGAISIEEQLADLRTMLQVTNVQQVKDAIATANKRASEQRTSSGFGKNENERLRFAREFEQVAEQLQYYLTYLNAEVALKTDGHRVAIRQINDLLQKHSGNMDEVFVNQVRKRLNDLRRESVLLTENAEVLNKITQVLQQSNTRNKIPSLLQDLAQVDRFIDDEQREQWSESVRKTLGLLSVQTPFDRVQLDKIFLTLNRVDVVEYDVWSGRLRFVMMAQEARDQEIAGQIELARENWVELKDKLGDEDRQYVIEQINSLDLKLLEQMRNALLQDADSTMSDSVSNIWRQQMSDLLTQLKQAVLDSRDEMYRLNFMIMAVEVELRYAQESPENRIRERLDSAGTFAAQYLESQINSVITARNRGKLNYDNHVIDDMVQDAKRALVVSLVAPDLGRATQFILEDLNLNSSVDRYKSALDMWEQVTQNVTTNHPFKDDINTSYPLLFQSVYAPLLNWFATMSEALQRTLRSAIEEAKQDNRELLSHDVLAAASKLLLLNRSDPAGLRIVRQLAGLTFQLKERFDTLINTLATARGYEGSQPQAKFMEQRKYIAEQIEYVQLIRRVSEQLPENVLQDKSPRTIADTCLMYLRLYENVDDQMRQIQSLGDEFRKKLKNFSFDDETFDHVTSTFSSMREEFNTSIDEAARRIITRLKQIDVVDMDFSFDSLEKFSEKHPWTQDLIEESKRLQKLYELFVSVITDVKDVIENNKPIDHASRKINQYIIEKYDEFRLSKLYTTVSIVVDAKDNRRLIGWKNITEHVKSSVGIFDKIHQWSEPYYTEKDPVPPSRLVVNWANLTDNMLMEKITQQYADDPFAIYEDELLKSHIEGCLMIENYAEGVKYQIEYLLACGRFSEASDLLNRVLDPDASTAGLLKSLLSLAEADAIFSRPPLADEDRKTDSYDEAREHAGSEQGRERLTWMETFRYAPYRIYKEDAERMLKQMQRMESEWDDLVEDYEAQLEALDINTEELESANFMNQGRRKKATCEALEDCDKTVRQMRRLCPLHKDLTYWAKHHIILQAEAVITDKGGC